MLFTVMVRHKKTRGREGVNHAAPKTPQPVSERAIGTQEIRADERLEPYTFLRFVGEAEPRQRFGRRQHADEREERGVVRNRRRNPSK